MLVPAMQSTPMPGILDGPDHAQVRESARRAATSAKPIFGRLPSACFVIAVFSIPAFHRPSRVAQAHPATAY